MHINDKVRLKRPWDFLPKKIKGIVIDVHPKNTLIHPFKDFHCLEVEFDILDEKDKFIDEVIEIVPLKYLKLVERWVLPNIKE